MVAYVDFSGKLLKADNFSRTEDSISKKTWVLENETAYGFSRLPSLNMLKKRKTLEKCPHAYKILQSSMSLSIISSSKLSWKLDFKSPEEKDLWIQGHILRKTKIS